VIILGIDPGYAILGWSVIDSGLRLIDYGAIETSPGKKIDQRIYEIHLGLEDIISRYRPDCVAIEKLYFQKNTKTAMDVARTIGAVLLTIRLAGLDYSEYTPTQVKQAITGFGRATKDQMQVMIKTIFGIKEVPRPDDAADAVAIAACHSFRGRVYREMHY